MYSVKADMYTVEVSSDNFENITTYPISEQSITIGGLNSSTFYSVRVRRDLDTLTSLPIAITTSALVLGNGNQQAKADIEIFPNPSKGLITVTGLENEKNYGVTIKDASGSTLFSISTLSGSSLSSKIEEALSSAEDGLYFVTIACDNRTITNKLLLDRP